MPGLKISHFWGFTVPSKEFDVLYVYNVVLRRQWPRQKGTMVRILKRSTAIPAEFDPVGYNAEEPELEEDHEQKWGLSDLDEADNFEPHEG